MPKINATKTAKQRENSKETLQVGHDVCTDSVWHLVDSCFLIDTEASSQFEKPFEMCFVKICTAQYGVPVCNYTRMTKNKVVRFIVIYQQPFLNHDVLIFFHWTLQTKTMLGNLKSLADSERGYIHMKRTQRVTECILCTEEKNKHTKPLFHFSSKYKRRATFLIYSELKIKQVENRQEGNDQESIQLPNTFRPRHQRKEGRT